MYRVDPEDYPISRLDIVPGMRLGQLTIEKILYGPRGGVRGVVARCTCGMTSTPEIRNLCRGRSRACPACADVIFQATKQRMHAAARKHGWGARKAMLRGEFRYPEKSKERELLEFLE